MGVDGGVGVIGWMVDVVVGVGSVVDVAGGGDGVRVGATVGWQAINVSIKRWISPEIWNLDMARLSVGYRTGE